MRITEQSRTRLLINNLQLRNERISRLYEQLSSQQQVRRPSDDPVKAGAILRLNEQISALQQNRQSIEYAQSFSSAALEGLQSCEDVVTQAITLALRANNGTLSQENRESIAVELNQIIEILAQRANDEFEGRHIYAGSRTDAPPLTANRNADGEIESFSYAGGDEPLALPVNVSRSTVVSVTAQDTFIDSGLLPALVSLRDNLRNTAGLSDAGLTAAMQADLDNLNTANSTLLANTGAMGARMAELDVLLSQTESGITRTQEALSQTQDVDVAQLAVQMQQEQIVYEALLSASSKISRNSLMDYL